MNRQRWCVWWQRKYITKGKKVVATFTCHNNITRSKNDVSRSKILPVRNQGHNLNKWPARVDTDKKISKQLFMIPHTCQSQQHFYKLIQPFIVDATSKHQSDNRWSPKFFHCSTFDCPGTRRVDTEEWSHSQRSMHSSVEGIFSLSFSAATWKNWNKNINYIGETNNTNPKSNFAKSRI